MLSTVLVVHFVCMALSFWGGCNPLNPPPRSATGTTVPYHLNPPIIDNYGLKCHLGPCKLPNLMITIISGYSQILQLTGDIKFYLLHQELIACLTLCGFYNFAYGCQIMGNAVRITFS